MANDGININLLVERQPNHLFITDSCENGIGGFSLKSGRAFRFEIPNHLKGRVSNNVLEHLALTLCIQDERYTNEINLVNVEGRVRGED